MESPIIDTTPQLASEVQSEKHRREEHLHMLQRQAEDAVKAAEAVSQPSIGRLYNDIDDGIMEEAERTLNALNAAPDALQVLAEINKKKELKAVDHSSIEYLPIRKNLFIIPRALAELNSEEVALRRDLMGLKVRGPHAPPPVSSFNECGLSEIILAALTKQNIVTPFPVQAQCMPCIMAGRSF
jgi:ATP-dependent RNA helicase DDX46/PRP5